jgi:type IV pilus assembly protein PilW
MYKGTRREGEKGFTLIELLVVVAISGVIFGAVAMTYRTQQRSYVVQEHVATMQQNLRAAKYFLEKEVRMAGCDPTNVAGARILTANSNSMSFTMDINSDANDGFPDGDLGDQNESVAYSLADVTPTDGDNDLVRNTGGGNQLVAENIDAIDFVYLDVNENVLNPPDAGGNPTNVSAMGIPFIRTVEITILAKTGRRIRGWTEPNPNYTNRRGTVIFTPPANDPFRRRIITTCIKCRNL